MLMTIPSTSLPILYGLDSKGRTKIWRGLAYGDLDGTAGFKIFSGLKEGKHAERGKFIRVGKNVGRSNETTPYEQAILEITSKWTKKRDLEGYTETEENMIVPKLPMLAQSFDKKKHKIKYPAFVQRKYNGVRDFGLHRSRDIITHTSRKGKPYNTLNHLESDLKSIMKVDDIFDGEVYNHDMTFQEITSAIKKQREDSLRLEFHVYDLADSDMDFEDRYKKLEEAFKLIPNDSQVKLVETVEVFSEEEMQRIHDDWVKEGYEGIIIRNKKGGYSFKHRSENLQKYKEFIDEEFEIVGGYPGEGTSFEGMVTFECKAKNGEVFGVVPKGSHEYKRELWGDLGNIIGKQLTIRYQELSDAGIPIFPVGIVIRDYE